MDGYSEERSEIEIDLENKDDLRYQNHSGGKDLEDYKDYKDFKDYSLHSIHQPVKTAVVHRLIAKLDYHPTINSS